MRVELCRSERRKKLLIACGLIAVFLAYCFASPFVVSAIKKEKSKSLTIVVDAGHGGEDGGVKGAKTGVEEKNINLIVAKYLGEMLCACGFNVVYTRRNDVMHNFNGVKNNKKRADMFPPRSNRQRRQALRRGQHTYEFLFHAYKTRRANVFCKIEQRGRNICKGVAKCAQCRNQFQRGR